MVRVRPLVVPVIATLGIICSAPAYAWGSLGHKVTALVAYKHLTPSARAKLDTLLASDPDTLTPPDFASRATWADAYRQTHRETSEWHFADIELSDGDLAKACFGFPKLAAGTPASLGPAEDCVVNKIGQFEAELGDPATSPDERRLALKFLIHFVGDLHQPLHASDDHDKGGNCVKVTLEGSGRETNLHSFWDTGVVTTLGQSPEEIADTLDAQITQGEAREWSDVSVEGWAKESSQWARMAVYSFPERPSCDAPGSPVVLGEAYQARAKMVAAWQLKKAGIRMAVALNSALGS